MHKLFYVEKIYFMFILCVFICWRLLFCNTDKIYFASTATVYYRWTNNENISTYNDYQKVNDAIHSWKLIEQNLKIRFKSEFNTYIDSVKEVVYKSVNNSFPDLIDMHSHFFKNQIAHNRITQKIKLKLFQFLKKWIN